MAMTPEKEASIEAALRQGATLKEVCRTCKASPAQVKEVRVKFGLAAAGPGPQKTAHKKRAKTKAPPRAPVAFDAQISAECVTIGEVKITTQAEAQQFAEAIFALADLAMLP